jgi:vacuolar-type H+-ATPase subunit I/STV1
MGTSEMVGTRIGIISSSGMLRVTIPPRRSWLLILLEIAVSLVVVIWVYGSWTKMSLLFHVLFIWGIVTAFLALIYQLSVTQVIEFDSQRITVCKEIRGWERKKEYRVEDCSELEWSEGSEHQPAMLGCKAGWRTVKVCEDLSEDESIEILTALQRSLPDVAQKLCSYPRSKEHFLTLGIGKQ